eukprot:27270-Alexandrium_andersonii.AAC.1
MVRVDAAQFFKAANLQRGRHHAHMLLQHIRRSKGADALRLLRPTKAQGKLVRAAAGSASRAVITFKEIENAFLYATHDTEMVLGTTTVALQGGWPTGGSLSEPATLVDLGRHVRA